MLEEQDNFPKLEVEGYALTNAGKPPKRGEKKLLKLKLPKKGDQTTNVENPNANNVNVGNFGDVITNDLANYLVKDFYKKFNLTINDAVKSLKLFPDKILSQEQEEELVKNLTEQIAPLIPFKVTFSKQALLMLLSQPNCAGIKSYYCVGLEEVGKPIKPSLTIVGVDKNDKDLKMDGSHNSGTIIVQPKIEKAELSKNQQFGNIESLANDEETLIYEVGGTDNVKTFNDPEVKSLLSQ